MPAPVAQSTIDTVAQRGSYTLNINPRQVLINNIGIDNYLGGGNLSAGQSAAQLDSVLVSLESYGTRARVELDTGSTYARWTPVDIQDVHRLRAAFFALYGLGKPNWYGEPYAENPE